MFIHGVQRAHDEVQNLNFQWRHCEFTSSKSFVPKTIINFDASATMIKKKKKSKTLKKKVLRFWYTGFFIEFVSIWKHAVQLFLLKSCLSFELGATLLQSIQYGSLFYCTMYDSCPFLCPSWQIMMWLYIVPYLFTENKMSSFPSTT